jgi:hypothetical protein
MLRFDYSISQAIQNYHIFMIVAAKKMGYNQGHRKTEGGHAVMEGVVVGETQVSFQVSGAHIPPRHTLEQLVRRAQAQSGQKPWEAMEISCFAGAGQVLVLARPGPEPIQVFFFPDLDSLVAGALCSRTGKSQLYCLEDGFGLAVEKKNIVPALFEFGDPLDVGPEWLCHAREQGQCLLEEEAIGKIKGYFTTGSNDCEIR